MKNNLTSQQLHTALSLWFTREVKISECSSPKPQLKLLLLHQTSPLVTIIITTALRRGKKKAHDAQECMETEGHRALKLQKKPHSSRLTILISPFIHQIPHYVELLPGTLISLSKTQTVPQTLGGGQTCNEGGSPKGQSRCSHVTCK